MSIISDFFTRTGVFLSRSPSPEEEYYNYDPDRYINYRTKKSIFRFRRIVTFLAIFYSFNLYFLVLYLSLCEYYYLSFCYHYRLSWFRELEGELQVWLIIALITSSTALTAFMLRGLYNGPQSDSSENTTSQAANNIPPPTS